MIKTVDSQGNVLNLCLPTDLLEKKTALFRTIQLTTQFKDTGGLRNSPVLRDVIVWWTGQIGKSKARMT